MTASHPPTYLLDQKSQHTLLVPKICFSLWILSQKLRRWWSECGNELGEVSSIIKISILITCCEESLRL